MHAFVQQQPEYSALNCAKTAHLLSPNSAKIPYNFRGLRPPPPAPAKEGEEEGERKKREGGAQGKAKIVGICSPKSAVYP